MKCNQSRPGFELVSPCPFPITITITPRVLPRAPYIYIYIYMICKQILLITFLNEPKLILLHALKWLQVFLCITNNSIKHQSFVYTQLNVQTVLFLTIQSNISILFVLSFHVKQFYLTYRLDPITCYHTGPEWTWEL